MKKTIWIPLALGLALGLVDFVSLAVNFLIPLGPFGAAGPQEILLAIAAALGGPLALFFSSLFHDLGVYFFFLKNQLTPEQLWSIGGLFSLADLAAHLLALLAVAYGYRILHQRAKKLYTFVAGWFLIIVIYYTLLVPLQSYLIGFIIQDRPPLYALYQRNVPEFVVVVLITSLILIALPSRYSKPLWYEPQKAQDHAGEALKV